LTILPQLFDVINNECKVIFEITAIETHPQPRLTTHISISSINYFFSISYLYSFHFRVFIYNVFHTSWS